MAQNQELLKFNFRELRSGIDFMHSLGRDFQQAKKKWEMLSTDIRGDTPFDYQAAEAGLSLILDRHGWSLKTIGHTKEELDRRLTARAMDSVKWLEEELKKSELETRVCILKIHGQIMKSGRPPAEFGLEESTLTKLPTIETESPTAEIGTEG